MLIAAQQDLWQRQGFLMALAEVIRTNGANATSMVIVADILGARGLGVPQMVECGLEPPDVRELLKAIRGASISAEILPFQRRGGADLSQPSSATEDAR